MVVALFPIFISTLAVNLRGVSTACTPYNISSVIYVQASLLEEYGTGTIAKLCCTLTEKPVSVTFSVCINDRWVPEIKGCKDAKCSEHPPVANATLRYYPNVFIPEPRAPGSLLTMECDHSFIASGAICAICIGGNWSNRLGICVAC